MMDYFAPWDIIPLLGILALACAFVLRRRRMKREENQLQETLDSLCSGMDEDL